MQIKNEVDYEIFKFIRWSLSYGRLDNTWLNNTNCSGGGLIKWKRQIHLCESLDFSFKSSTESCVSLSKLPYL